ncbi:MAG: hypothetical protein BM564_02835 [Bacteroidetes bacterium MedPE-SWsnd-G2]|nr:MAG: hypothetical protein BM564_02835 [Bacteroidetes bacterium MedPE-SWsnd-G2]
MTIKPTTLNFIYTIGILLGFMPFSSPTLALAAGIILSLIGFKHPTITTFTSHTLQASIVLMGFGMNLTQVIETSKSGFGITAISVIAVMLLGLGLTKLLKVDSKIGTLISAGTAICGGSAIAAIAPITQAKNFQISFSLVVVFVLNALALVLFPAIGHYFNLSQEAFGNWAAIAIHDTSSVVGAAAIYGPEALEIATTVKLIRALWIIPLSLVVAFFYKGGTSNKIKIPWFIFMFVGSILIAYYLPQFSDTYFGLNWLGHKGMIVALFLIGSGISIKDAKQAGVKSFMLGILLWIFISIGSFLVLT